MNYFGMALLVIIGAVFGIIGYDTYRIMSPADQEIDIPPCVCEPKTCEPVDYGCDPETVVEYQWYQDEEVVAELNTCTEEKTALTEERTALINEIQEKDLLIEDQRNTINELLGT